MKREEEEENLKRGELSGGSGLFEKLGGGVEEIGPAAHVLIGRHGISSLARSEYERGKI